MRSGQGEKPWGWHAPVLSWHRLNRGWGLVGVAEGPGRVLPACAGGPAQGKACQLWPWCLTQDRQRSLDVAGVAVSRQCTCWLTVDHFTSFHSLQGSPLPRSLATLAPPRSLLPTCRQLFAMVSGWDCTDFPGLGLGGCGEEDAGPAGMTEEWSLSVL